MESRPSREEELDRLARLHQWRALSPDSNLPLDERLVELDLMGLHQMVADAAVEKNLEQQLVEKPAEGEKNV
jgi:hypothetical protein